MDDLLTDFISETRDTLEAIAGEVVAWEADPTDRTRLDAIFRFVHTVKGSCGFLDLPRLGRLSHAAEDVLAELRAGTREADAALVSAVLAVVDRIGEITDAMESGEGLPDSEDATLVAALARETTTEAAVAPSPGKPAPSRALARSIRLPVELLDRLMAGVSDMVLARNELARTLREAGLAEADPAFERLSLCVGEIRDAITRTRMARIDGVFSLLPRMVRDLSGQLGRQVQLEVDGGDVELDREMIEMIRDPLTQIVRNAIDHGIEPPAERAAAGKAVAGLLRVTARQSGNQILIEASDDGRGVDGEKLVRKALNAGAITPERAAAMSWAQRIELVFLPGLSTAASVSEISGRGVGMDVVRANIERIGGAVEIESRPGRGMKLTMRVPLTLTIIPTLVVDVRGHCFAIPRAAIDEIVRPTGDAVRLGQIGDAVVATIRGETVPLVDLGLLLDCPRRDAEDMVWPVLVVVRTGTNERFALSVDAVLDHEELVVKPAAPEVMAAGVYAGTALPDDSRPTLLLDIAGIAAVAGLAGSGIAPAMARTAAPAIAAVPTLMFRDLDGRDRAVRLALVERIADVARSTVAESGGRLRLAFDGELVALAASAPIEPGPALLRILQIGDGTARVAYAIDQVIDVVDLPEEFVPAAAAGPIAGTLLVDGRAIELIDPHWLFRDVRLQADRAVRPLCLIADEGDPWARQLLQPLLAAAGYRVALGAAEVRDADVIIAAAHVALPDRSTVPVVRLRPTEAAETDDASVWRYDREGLLGAIAAATRGGRG